MIKKLKKVLYKNTVISLKVFAAILLFFGLIAFCTRNDKKEATQLTTEATKPIEQVKQQKSKLLKKGLFVCTSEENLKEFMNYATNNDMEGVKALIKGKHCLEIPCDCLQYSILDLSFSGVAKVRIWMPGKESDSDIVWTMKNALNEFDN